MTTLTQNYIFFTYIKVSKDSSAKYYQNNIERLQLKVFLKKIKKKSDNMVVNDTKIYQKMKNKGLFSIGKKYCKMRKNRLL